MPVIGLYPAKGLLISSRHRIELQWGLIPITFFNLIMTFIMFIGAFLHLYIELKHHECVSDIAGTGNSKGIIPLEKDKIRYILPVAQRSMVLNRSFRLNTNRKLNLSMK